MAKKIKKKSSFGTVDVNHFSPSKKEGWPTAINITLSFEEALKLHLGIGQALARLNEYNRATKDGRESAVNLCVFTDQAAITVNEGRAKPK